MPEFRIKTPTMHEMRMLEEAFRFIAKQQWEVVTYDVVPDDLVLPKGGEITQDDLMTGLLELARKQGMSVVADVLKSFGIDRLGKLPADQFAEFARAIEVANNMIRTNKDGG